MANWTAEFFDVFFFVFVFDTEAKSGPQIAARPDPARLTTKTSRSAPTSDSRFLSAVVLICLVVVRRDFRSEGIGQPVRALESKPRRMRHLELQALPRR